MKKLILMTSALTLMGGAAYADITISANASVKYGNWETGAGAAAFSFNTGAKLTLEQTAGDVTYGGSVSIDADAGTVSDGAIWVSTGWGKFSFGVDAFDELSDTDLTAAPDVNGVTPDADYGDVKYEGEFGAVSIVFVADAGMGNTNDGTVIATTAPAWDLGLDYDGNGWTFGLDIDSNNDYKASASVEFGDWEVGVAVDQASSVDVFVAGSFGGVKAKLSADDVTGTPVYGLKLNGTAGDVKWMLAGDSAGGAKASIDYSMDALSVGLAYDNDDAGTPGADYGDAADIILTVGYKVSDNMSIGLKVNDQGEYEAETKLAFEY